MHNAEDVMGEVDWDEWPDFELFGDGEDTSAAPYEDDVASV